MVSRHESDRDSQFVHETKPDSGGDLGAMITSDVLWDPIESEHMTNYYFLLSLDLRRSMRK